MAALTRPARRGAPLVAVLAAVLAGLAVLVPGGAAYAATEQPAPPGEPGHPWFGPQLDWAVDLPADYAGRLGSTPSMYAQRVDYPLTARDRTYLRQFADQAATQGAVAVLTVEPTEALGDLTDADADDLASALAAAHRDDGSTFLVRFAPEMNGTWKTWGQQPDAYVAAFRRVAEAVHAATDSAAMVWSPSYGAGYPYRGSARQVPPSGPVDVAALDTNGDQRVTQADDAYAPYYPGDDVVDWVGLSIFYFGPDPGGNEQPDAVVNTVPPDGYYSTALAEAPGDDFPAQHQAFYDTYAAAADRPMLVDTGALYVPGAPGASELQVKQAWWQQVLAADADHPLIAGITWLEVERAEDEAGGLAVDWRATARPDVAQALASDLAAADVDLGPVTLVVDQDAGNEAAVQVRLPDTSIQGSELGWIVFCVALLAVAWLTAGGVGRWVPSWHYPDEHDPRDRRLDLFRGWIIITVVFTHIELNSPYTFVSLRMIGAITGAEMFVLLSGVVLGMIYAPTVRKLGEWGTAVVMFKRARKQYLVALAVVLIVYVLGRLPFLDGSDITTFTDRGTGEGGASAAGTVYDLYANGPRLLDYPPPWYAVKQLLLLEMGPWVFNIMGLFVVLSLALPALMYLVRRGYWWLMLAGSWALFVYGSLTDVHLFASQFEAVFPLFLWQLPFTHGLVVGTYRRQITAALTSWVGKAAATVVILGYAAVMGYLWLAHHQGFDPAPFPDDSYAWLYQHAYTRVVLQFGRLIDLAVLLVVAHAVLTTCWKPIDKAIGWLWIPMGQASLYVFIVHVFFAFAVANLPGLDRSDIVVGTILHTVVILLIWRMVKKQVLFKVIPR